MNATKVLLKVQLVEDRKKSRFFFLYLSDFKGDQSELSEVDDHISENLSLREVVDLYGPIYDWEVISAETAEGEFYENQIESTEDPKKIKKAEKKKKEIAKFEKNLEDYKVDVNKDVKTDLKKGILSIKNKAFGKLEIPLMTIYSLIEKDTEGDATLTNSFGETILELTQGSYLNAGLADIQVFDSEDDMKKHSILSPKAKGGIFVRDRGVLHIGDINRTRCIELDLSALVKEMYLKGMIGKPTNYLEQLNLIETK
jgi:hypothetical protein